MFHLARSFMNSAFRIRKQFGLGCVLFAAGVWAGAVDESIHHLLDSQMRQLKEVAQSLEHSANPTLSFILFIFLNNAVKALLVMGTGLFFGIAPVLFLVMNGMVLGYLWRTTSESIGMQETWIHLAKGILPHGIVELPVIILACAYGLKMGGFAFRWIGRRSLRSGGLRLGDEFKSFARQLLAAGAGIAILLLLAAIIESTLTRWILQL